MCLALLLLDAFFMFILLAELKINKRTNKVFGLLHGECHCKSASRPGTNGLAH